MNDLLKQVAQPLDQSTRLIPLTQGQFAIVDAEDFDWLNQWKWCAAWSPTTESFYAMRSGPHPNRATIYMHREIMSADTEQEVDHVNLDSLDNRRINLRPCTSGQNSQHRTKRSHSASPFKGVTFSRKCSNWRSRIMVNQRSLHLGYFDSQEQAALAYDEAAKKHFREFAVLNFPER